MLPNNSVNYKSQGEKNGTNLHRI